MGFLAILVGLVVLFIVMFWFVKSGRLTMYWAGIEIALIKAEPILSTIEGFDFGEMLTGQQQGWVLFVATVLLGIARKRREIREAIGVPRTDGA